MTSEIIILAAGCALTWWTFAVVVFVVSLMELRPDDGRAYVLIIGASVLWPLTSLYVLPAMTYRAFVMSAKAIRTDLRNRKLLSEFDEFIAQKEKQENDH